MRRKGVLLVTAVALVSLPGLAAAQEESTTTTAPAAAPTTTIAPEPQAAPEAVVGVGDEASFRAALVALSADPAGPHTIDLTADITLALGTDPTYTGTEDLTIDGHGFVLDGGGTSRVLDIASPTPVSVTFFEVTVTGGSTTGNGGAVIARNGSTVSLNRSTFFGNQADGAGGAAFATGSFTALSSTIVDNAAGTRGGAVATSGFGANDQLGFIYATVTGNAAPAGANLSLDGGQFGLIGAVIAEPAGGGRNCLRTGGSTGGGASFLDDDSCGGNPSPGVDPLLGPLQDNGGPTPTRLPLPGSPLIDAFWVDAAPQVLPSCDQVGGIDAIDQRGEPRLVDGDHETRISMFHGPRPVQADCDIGAVEAAFVAVPGEPTEPTGPVAAAPGFTG
jgi:hypothetical protein